MQNPRLGCKWTKNTHLLCIPSFSLKYVRCGPFNVLVYVEHSPSFTVELRARALWRSFSGLKQKLSKYNANFRRRFSSNQVRGETRASIFLSIVLRMSKHHKTGPSEHSMCVKVSFVVCSLSQLFISTKFISYVLVLHVVFALTVHVLNE